MRKLLVLAAAAAICACSQPQPIATAEAEPAAQPGVVQASFEADGKVIKPSDWRR